MVNKLARPMGLFVRGKHYFKFAQSSSFVKLLIFVSVHEIEEW